MNKFAKNVVYIPVSSFEHVRGSFNYLCFKKLMNKFAKNVVYIPVPSFENVRGSFNYLGF